MYRDMMKMGGALVIGILLMFGWLRYQHWQQDETNFHAIALVIQYNVQQGRLVIPPELQTPPTVTLPKPPDVPLPKPPEKEKEKPKG